MTREEYKDLEATMDKLVDLALTQKKLPQGLDEAAKKYGKEHVILPENYNDGDIPDYEEYTANAFKAGAKWMAEQGVSFEDEVLDKAVELGYGRLIGLESIINLPESLFDAGDKVIVQIRKI